MKLKIKRLDTSLLLPRYHSDGASGIDLYATEDTALTFGIPERMSTGIAVEIPEGFEGQVRPRSSLSFSGQWAALGTIDADYRGEISVVLVNLRPGTIELFRGQRIAQLVIAPVGRCEIEEVEELGETARGTGGFGSTGT